MPEQVFLDQTCSILDNEQDVFAFSPVLCLWSPNANRSPEPGRNEKRLVYACNGSTLSRFCLRDATMVSSQRNCVFKQRNSSVFGIAPAASNDEYLVIYGERSLVFYRGGNLFRPISAVYNFKEWIQTAHFLQNGTLAVLFGCNATVLFCVKEISDSQNTVGLVESVRVQSDHKAVLSHALMVGRNWEELKTFVGTAFGDILISIPAQGSGVLHRLSDHTGMIFGLCLTDEHLFSISDDRKLVMWDVGRYVTVDSVYGHSTRPFAICKGSNGIIITGCQDSYINIWSTALNRLSFLQKICVGRGPVRSLLVLGSYLLIGTEAGFFGSLSLPSELTGARSFRFKHDLPVRNFCCVSSELQYFVDENGDIYKKFGRSVIRVHGIKCHRAEFFSTSSCRRFIAIADPHCCFLIDAGDGSKITVFEAEENIRLLSCHWSYNNLFLSYSNGIVKRVVVGSPTSLLETLEFDIGLKHCASAFLTEGESVIIGTKKGKIMIAQHGKIVGITNAHGREAVTDLIMYRNNLYSIGRDGKICMWDHRGDFRKGIILVECGRISQTIIIEWPCKFLVFNNSLYIAGFHGATFYLVNYETDHCVCQCVCGGGHRNWEILLVEKQDIRPYCYLCFINKGCIFETILELYEMTVFMPNAHVSTMTSVCTLASKHTTPLMLTASFDTTITMSSIDSDNELVSVLCRSRKHTSSVHSLSSFGNYAISAGGKSELCLWSTEKGPFLMKVSQVRLDSYCRLISVSLYSVEPISFVVSGSDGRLLLITWINKIENSLDLILPLHTFLSDHFLYTKVCGVKSGEKVTIFAATSAGVLVCWPDINNPRRISDIFLEKAGLSALDGRYFGSNPVAAVGSESGCVMVVKFFSNDVTKDYIYWHGATCTDLKFFTAPSEETFIISTSIDCRLAVFRYNEAANKLIFYRAVVLSVADPSSLCLLTDFTDIVTAVVVVGCGIQVVKISKLLY